MPAAGRHLDRRVDHDGRRRVAVVERGGVDERLERRARLAQRLGGAVEDARLVGEAALHRQHAAGLGVHRHEAALDRRDLAVGPALAVLAGPPRRRRRRRPTCRPGPSAGAQPAVLVAQPRPARILEAEEVAVRVLRHALDADARRALADREHHRRVPAVDVARHRGGAERPPPAASSAGSKLAGSICATGPR